MGDFLCRLLNNSTYLGMLSEVRDQYVDMSIAAYIWTAERNTLVDFTHGIGFTTIILLIRRPSKHDLSFRYFFLGKEILISLIFALINHPVNRIYITFMVNAGLALYGFVNILWSHIILHEEFWY